MALDNPSFDGIELDEFERRRRNKDDKTPRERSYGYEEALDLVGVGRYSRCLLLTLSASLLGMAADMFGFSVVVAGSACDLQLDHFQKTVLISTPFIGPILMSYWWGFVSDTRGRRRALLLGLWGGFLASVASAFSTHWLMLAALKVLGTSFSSCVQSVCYPLLGEAVAARARGCYSALMTSALMLFMMAYAVPGYYILNLTFHSNWGFVLFTPWRLLALVIAAPLGISAVALHQFCDSPKFLLNAGRHDEALESLRVIWTGNGNEGEYPVTKVVLEEEPRIRGKDESLLDSMWEQIVPLFRPPFLWRTLQLLYLTAVIYAINNSLVMWMPSIVEAFAAGISSGQHSGSLCDIIADSKNATGTVDLEMPCTSSIDRRTLFSGVIHGVTFSAITLLTATLANRKKMLMMSFLLVPLLASLGAVFNQNDVASLMLFVGMMMTNMCMGVLFAYFVELYPTSYRGMASCLGVMMSRLSGLAGVHFVGALVLNHCSSTLYAFAVYLLSGIIIAYFLPADELQKKAIDSNI